MRLRQVVTILDASTDREDASTIEGAVDVALAVLARRRDSWGPLRQPHIHILSVATDPSSPAVPDRLALTAMVVIKPDSGDHPVRGRAWHAHSCSPRSVSANKDWPLKVRSMSRHKVVSRPAASRMGSARPVSEIHAPTLLAISLRTHPRTRRGAVCTVGIPRAAFLSYRRTGPIHNGIWVRMRWSSKGINNRTPAFCPSGCHELPLQRSLKK